MYSAYSAMHVFFWPGTVLTRRVVSKTCVARKRRQHTRQGYIVRPMRRHLALSKLSATLPELSATPAKLSLALPKDQRHTPGTGGDMHTRKCHRDYRRCRRQPLRCRRCPVSIGETPESVYNTFEHDGTVGDSTVPWLSPTLLGGVGNCRRRHFRQCC